jgi:hypothetical protein
MNARTLAAALLICAASATYAQTASKAKAAEPAVEMKTDAQATAKAQASFLTGELGLDTKQAAEVEQVLLTTEEKASGLREHADKNKASLEKLSQSAFTKIKGLLNEEQAKKLEQLKADGKWDVCSTSTGKGCCAGHAAAAGGKACCAGKGAKAEAAPAKGK